MTRRALHTVHSFDETVEEQRPGFCLYLPQFPEHRFVAHGFGITDFRSPKIWTTRADIDYAHQMFGGSVIVTVPKWNGHVWEWTHLT